MKVSVLESMIQDQQARNEELKRKLDRLNEDFGNKQRFWFGCFGENSSYVTSNDQVSFAMKRKKNRSTRYKNTPLKPVYEKRKTPLRR